VPELPDLSDPVYEPRTDTPQRFLSGAYEAVEAVLGTLTTIREIRRQEGGDIRGRLTANEEDLLRAAVVFTGAGLDSTLKQLIRDTLPALLEVSDQAHTKLEGFAAEQLGTGEIADTSMIARYLTSASPRERLIEDYIYDLTGSSLQSAEEVQRVAGALGINDQTLRQRIGELKPMFTARNEISHELDLRRTDRPGDRTRRSRSIQPTKNLCHEGLEVGQQIINAVAEML
jgi:hypothetical protein